jgi:hypothetical protein
MKAVVIGFATLTLAFAASAQTAASFKRPDCSAYSASLKPERKCVREIRRIWQEANYAALQKTGLMFVYMARPEPKASPEAMKLIEKKVEGSFAIRFSVKTDGTVYDVQTVEVTDGVQPLAKAWAGAIAQWTFARTSQPVSGIEYRRIYMYSDEDDEDDDPSRSQHAAH